MDTKQKLEDLVDIFKMRAEITKSCTYESISNYTRGFKDGYAEACETCIEYLNNILKNQGEL